MKRVFFLFIAIFTFSIIVNASHKVFLIHGFAGLGIELEQIKTAITLQGYECEIYRYPSLTEDVNEVSKHLISEIQRQHLDSVSFVTHSLGALVVRALYGNLKPEFNFPFIHRFVMIASPNQGSPMADFWNQFGFVKYVAGPNVKNLTTDVQNGAPKYAVPTCEIGLIAGVTNRKMGYNILIVGDNDGLVPKKNAALGNEKDVVYVKSSHISLVFNKKTIKYVVAFLQIGHF
ncbi:MAG: esterase/lipase family protein [Paludibacter sp.]